ncbi:histidine phosphatase family protein [Romboutsia sp. CE17]|uniref:histidine phosphatase family protein n=1 Tax=Romboutsia sp. CE17 TaxID=2724150 RepID=UPI001442A870|nr:histidine phosphatase family protein [Romboutsia sp. CE17]QJA09635.1 histidine phosphatase family protein [Romboutsia sp. CE17]
MLKLILVRHAITEDNKGCKLSGHIDSILSEEGKKQIKDLNKFLQLEKIDKIYTTTSSRTKYTVEEIAQERNMEIIEKDTLKEISFGDFEGLDFNEIKDRYPDEFQKMIDEGYNYRYPNGESLVDSYNRVVKEIKDIVNNNDNKNILICSHGGTIRNILTYLISNSYNYHWNFRIDNCSVTTLEIDNGFAVINNMNNTSFLNS